MILSRVARHLKQQHWTAVFIDFVIVVVGVFLGLQVQEWSKQQEDRQREKQIVGDLLADLDIDRTQYATGLTVDMTRVSAANASLVDAGLPAIAFDRAKPIGFDPTEPNAIVDYSFDLHELPKIPETRFDRLWTDVVIGFFPTPSTSTYDAMAGSGDIKIIRDREIVREIQVYHNLTKSVTEQNEKLLPIRAEALKVGAIYGLAPYVNMPAKDYFRLVASEPRLAATIRIQAMFTIYHHGEIKTADAHAAQLQDRLRNYLKAAK